MEQSRADSREGNYPEPINLMRRCAIQLWRHGGLFLSILVLVVFPTIVLERVYEVAFVRTKVGSALYSKILFGDNTTFINNDDVHPGMIGPIVGPDLVGRLLHSVLSIIPYICIVYTLASILTNKAVVLADSAGAARRLWRPVIFTSLCLFAVDFGFIFFAASIVYTTSLKHQSLATLLFMLFTLVGSLVFIVLRIAFQLALVVALLEGVYGWKALDKSWKLVQQDLFLTISTPAFTFFLIFLIWSVKAMLEFLYPLMLGIFGVSTNPPRKSEFVPLLEFGFVTARASVWCMLTIATQTFLYFSCKALHGESIIHSEFFQSQVMQVNYGQQSDISRMAEENQPTLGDL